MSSNSAARPLRAYRHAGKLVLEIDEDRFCADSFLQSPSRIVDRDAYLAYACDHLFSLLHDDDDACHPTWWLRFAQALGEDAAHVGAGVRVDASEDLLAITQPPDLFPEEITRALLGQHCRETKLFPERRSLLEIGPALPERQPEAAR